MMLSGFRSFALVAIFVWLFVIYALATKEGMPGKVAMWRVQKESTAEEGSITTVHHNTATITVKDVEQYLKEQLDGSVDFVVMLSHEAPTASLLSNGAVMQALKADHSYQPVILSHVYRATESDVNIAAPIAAALSGASTLAEAQTIAAADLLPLLQQPQRQRQQHPSASAATPAYKLALSDKDLRQGDLAALFTSKIAANVIFVAFDEPHVDAVSSRLPRSQYHRILKSSDDDSSSSVDTTDHTSIYYKPEGAEYAIYYADTYLYLTPDIFTGVVTAIFMAVTVLLGLSCMGGIQGMSSFYSKCPPIGKEA